MMQAWLRRLLVAGLMFSGACNCENSDVTANDGEEDGIEQSSQEVLIGNSPPSIPAAILDPFSPSEDDVIYCDYMSFDDADGDSDQSSFQWTINGVDAGTSSVLSSGFENGDTVVCTITPFDGFDEGEPVTATALVADPVDCSTSGDGYWSSSWASSTSRPNLHHHLRRRPRHPRLFLAPRHPRRAAARAFQGTRGTGGAVFRT